MKLLSLSVAIWCALLMSALTAGASEKELVAKYHFDEGSGSQIADSSGNKQDGEIVGAATWTEGVRGKAVLFDGINRVSIPGLKELKLQHAVTISAWIKGHGGKFRMVRLPSSYPSLRGPYFQVCGETVYFASNSDHSSRENPDLSKDPTLKKHRDFPWNDWHLWTGTLDINLTDYRDIQRTRWPFTGLEPKLQVVGSKIYYEYFGQDETRAWQIWTAQSNTDGTGWHVVQRTYEPEGYRVEQEGNLQVAGNHVYDGWPEKDSKDEWQLWTSIANLDGSNFKATQRTTDGGWIPNIKVVGDQVFYMYPTIRNISKSPAPKTFNEKLYFAVSDTNGNGWKVLREIDHISFVPGGWGAFQVHDGRIYFTYSQVKGERGGYLFTGSMKVDGTDFQTMQRTFGDDLAGPVHNSLQVVGNKVYYTFNRRLTSKTVKELHDEARSVKDLGRGGLQVWTAEANLDGSDWTATQRTDGSRDIFAGYRGLQVVGGKIYVAAMESPRDPEDPVRMYAMMGTSGANLVAKGDTFGIGMTDRNDVRGFINAGLDFLVRAEAPADTAGAIADYGVDEAWHFVAMTYDGSILKLYVDGQLQTSAPYKAAIGTNPFPLVIGDGFEGVIDEVSIYGRALRADQIEAAAKRD